MDTAVARPELLLVADAVAREKNIDREEVLEAMEQAIQKAGRAKYGHARTSAPPSTARPAMCGCHAGSKRSR